MTFTEHFRNPTFIYNDKIIPESDQFYSLALYS